MPTNPFAALAAAFSPQLTYANNFSVPKPGTPYDIGEHAPQTAINETLYGVFGTIVVRDPAVPRGWKYAVNQGDVDKGVLGVLTRTGAIESRRDGYPPSYRPGDPANIQKFGRVWSAVEVAVAKHDPVYVRVVANGALSQLGALRNDNDGGKAILVNGAKFDTDAAEGAGVVVEINLLGA